MKFVVYIYNNILLLENLYKILFLNNKFYKMYNGMSISQNVCHKGTTVVFCLCCTL